MKKTLKAWKPYEVSRKCFYTLHELDSPGAFTDWDVYVLSGIISARSVWHVLKDTDSKISKLAKSVFDDYNDGPAKYMVAQSFVRGQRDRLLHEWSWDIVPQEVTIRKWLGGDYIGEAVDLVFDYPKHAEAAGEVPEDLQGEDPIRLLGISLQFLHRDLSKIEIALANGISNPFSGGVSESDYADSAFFDTEPSFYR